MYLRKSTKLTSYERARQFPFHNAQKVYLYTTNIAAINTIYLCTQQRRYISASELEPTEYTVKEFMGNMQYKRCFRKSNIKAKLGNTCKSK